MRLLWAFLLTAISAATSHSIAATTMIELDYRSCAMVDRWINMPCGQEAVPICAFPWYTINWYPLQVGEVRGNGFEDALPLDTIVTDVDVTLYMYQSRSNLKLAASFNDHSLGTVSDPGETACLKYGVDSPYCQIVDYTFKESCLHPRFDGDSNGSGIPWYHYGGLNVFNISMAPNTSAPEIVLLQHAEVYLTYSDRPGIKTIQAGAGTQDIYEYHTQALAHALPANGKYLFLGDPNEIPERNAPYKGQFLEPLVVPYGQAFTVKVELYDSEEIPNETFTCDWAIDQKHKGTLENLTDRVFISKCRPRRRPWEWTPI